MPWLAVEPGIELYYDVDDFTDPWRKPEAVVFQHGNGKSSRFWYGWVPLLAREYKVVRFDARGFGQSTEPPAGYQLSLSGFARDIRLLLDHLDLEKVHLVGETVGGSISMQFAFEYPQRLLSLTVCSSPFRFTDPQTFENQGREVAKIGTLAWARSTIHRRLDISQVDPAFVEWYANEMGKSSARMVSEAFLAVAGNDLSDIMRQIKVPTLLLYPENRPGQTREYRLEMQQLIPNSKLVEFPGVTGFVQHSHPERCVEAFKAFVHGLKSPQ